MKAALEKQIKVETGESVMIIDEPERPEESGLHMLAFGPVIESSSDLL